MKHHRKGNKEKLSFLPGSVRIGEAKIENMHTYTDTR